MANMQTMVLGGVLGNAPRFRWMVKYMEQLELIAATVIKYHQMGIEINVYDIARRYDWNYDVVLCVCRELKQSNRIDDFA